MEILVILSTLSTRQTHQVDVGAVPFIYFFIASNKQDQLFHFPYCLLEASKPRNMKILHRTISFIALLSTSLPSKLGDLCLRKAMRFCLQANTSGNELSSTLMNTGASRRLAPRPQNQVTVHAWLFNQTQQQPYNHNGWKTHSMGTQMARKPDTKPNLQKPLSIFTLYGVWGRVGWVPILRVP